MSSQRIVLGLAVVAAAAVLAARAGMGRRLVYAAAAGTAHPARLTQSGLVLTKGSRATTGPTEIAAFAAGCFWGVEEEFRKQSGVVATAVGFMGGHTNDPTYEEVCTDATGHAETVEVEFDPKVVSYDQLLELFWDMHDPTTPNRQGPDRGSQYRSVIFFFTPDQKTRALASKDRLQASGELSAPIVTEIQPASKFTNAEEYHQQYVEKGGIASCHRRKSHA